MATIDDLVLENLSGMDNQSTLLGSGDYALIRLDNSFLMNDHEVSLFNPDGMKIYNMSVGINDSCKSKINSNQKNGLLSSPL